MEDRILGLFWCGFFRQLFPHFQNQVGGLCSTHLTCDRTAVLVVATHTIVQYLGSIVVRTTGPFLVFLYK